VTGSSGKTTTKDLLGRILRRQAPTLVTQGNLNNRIGVPLQLQRLQTRHRWAVLEIAMNAPGEIQALADMTSPEIGVITNVGDAHVGMFNGDRRRVLRAKAEMLAHIPSDGAVVLNADDREPTAALTRRARRLGLRVVRFSVAGSRRADLWVEDIRPAAPIGHRAVLARHHRFGQADGGLATQRRRVEVRLPVFGRHNLANLAAAAAAALCAGVRLREIPPALRGFETAGLRSSVRKVAGATVVVDCYNANPQSMAEALASLGALRCAGKRVAVLGDMRELGRRSAAFHRALGEAVRRSSAEHLVTFGQEARLIAERARGVRSRHFRRPEACAAHLRRLLEPGDLVLVKGSRLLAMENIVDALETRR
jgi:UDP-N-acetylmuramoyl-tripeptide--D-alanyl-D-alanine ligase